MGSVAATPQFCARVIELCLVSTPGPIVVLSPGTARLVTFDDVGPDGRLHLVLASGERFHPRPSDLIGVVAPAGVVTRQAGRTPAGPAPVVAAMSGLSRLAGSALAPAQRVCVEAALVQLAALVLDVS